MRRQTRIVEDLNPGDEIRCNRCEQWKPHEQFNSNGEKRPGRRASYGTRCKPCDADHLREVFGGSGASGQGVKLASAGHSGQRESLPRTPEVEHALGVIRDVRGAQEGKQGYVYFIIEDVPGGGFSSGKIGFSTNPQARVGELQEGNPRRLKLLCAKKGTMEDEAALHRKYHDRNILQEWFSVTKEMLLEFDLDENLVPFGGTRTGRMSCGKKAA